MAVDHSLARDRPVRNSSWPGCRAQAVLGWLTTVDHKRIGLLYFFATTAFFLAGGVEALVMRTQLAQPDEHRRLSRPPTTSCSPRTA